MCRYSLQWQTGSDSFFDIETVEGIISTNEYLDRETAVQHNITVVATKLSKYSTPITTHNYQQYTCVSETVQTLTVQTGHLITISSTKQMLVRNSNINVG